MNQDNRCAQPCTAGPRRRELDEFSAARIRLLWAELDALDPDEAERIATDPVRGPLLRAAIDFPKHVRRRWVCPLCQAVTLSVEPPPGWHIVEPFTRVAACAVCRPHLTGAS